MVMCVVVGDRYGDVCGRFRLERGLRYFAALQAVFGGVGRHRLEVVADVGHDHSLMWDGSLQQLFA